MAGPMTAATLSSAARRRVERVEPTGRVSLHELDGVPATPPTGSSPPAPPTGCPRRPIDPRETTHPAARPPARTAPTARRAARRGSRRRRRPRRAAPPRGGAADLKERGAVTALLFHRATDKPLAGSPGKRTTILCVALLIVSGCASDRTTWPGRHVRLDRHHHAAPGARRLDTTLGQAYLDAPVTTSSSSCWTPVRTSSPATVRTTRPRTRTASSPSTPSDSRPTSPSR